MKRAGLFFGRWFAVLAVALAAVLSGESVHAQTVNAEEVDPENEINQNTQWVVFEIQPQWVILNLDDTTVNVRDGYYQAELPLGKHKYSLMAPFYEPQGDTFRLNREATLRINVALQACYSYLTVQAPSRKLHIWVDDVEIGRGTATSNRLDTGQHRVVLRYKKELCYERTVNIGPREKQLLEIEDYECDCILSRKEKRKKRKEEKESLPFDTVYAMLNIECEPVNAWVRLNGEFAGNTPFIMPVPVLEKKYKIRVEMGGYWTARRKWDSSSALAGEKIEVKLKKKCR